MQRRLLVRKSYRNDIFYEFFTSKWSWPVTCCKVVFGLVYRKEKMVTRQKTSCVIGRDGDKIQRQN
jgi:hypothetical protein